MAELKGKAGIVTGGSSGIGFQIANVLAEAGATVYVISRTGKPKEGVGESAPGVRLPFAHMNPRDREDAGRPPGRCRGPGCRRFSFFSLQSHLSNQRKLMRFLVYHTTAKYKRARL